MKNTARVKIVVTVECSSTWGETCTIAQLKKQAKDEAVELAVRALHADPRVKGVAAGDVEFSATL